jgi:hypothetical protein
MNREKLVAALQKISLFVTDSRVRRSDIVKALKVAASKKTVGEWETVDHGVTASDYFQGAGSGDYDMVFTGIGYSLKEALEDAAEQLASAGWEIPEGLEKEIEEADDKDEVADVINRDKPAMEWTVKHRSIPMGSLLLEDTFDSHEDALEFVTKRLEKLEKEGFEISELGDDEWEVGEPEDSGMVPDNVGYITITDNSEELDIWQEAADESEVQYFASIRVSEQKEDE